MAFCGCVAIESLAQQAGVDVIYLKNGSILRGVIVEMVPNQQIKLQTKDGSLFVYRMDEVEKMVKEGGEKAVPAKKVAEPQANGPVAKKKAKRGFIGFSGGVPVAVAVDDAPIGVGIDLIDFGHMFSRHVGIGAKWSGLGWADDNRAVGMGSLMVGPMFKVASMGARQNPLYIRPLVGMASFTEPKTDPYTSQTQWETTDSEFAFSVDCMANIALGNSFSLRCGIETYIKPITVVMPKVGLTWQW